MNLAMPMTMLNRAQTFLYFHVLVLSVQNDDIRMDDSEWHSQATEQTLVRETFNLLGYI